MAITITDLGIVYTDNSIQDTSPTGSVSHGDLVKVDTYTSGTNTWTKPANCTKVFVKLIGGGGGSAGYCEAGGAGGYAEGIFDMTGVSTVTVTVGGGGGGVGYYAAAGTGGTTSFGGYLTATGGGGANTYSSHSGGHGGIGSGGSINLYGGAGRGHSNSIGHGTASQGGQGYFGGSAGYNRATNNSKAYVGAPGTGAPGGRTNDGSTGVAGEAGLVIVYSYK
jgi:hypothetical protein